ncbi:hypothetical protein ABE10_02090, partial [Bacillus toyonensis]|nr:hypothetical protein [Bacillus toyonensis]
GLTSHQGEDHGDRIVDVEIVPHHRPGPGSDDREPFGDSPQHDRDEPLAPGRRLPRSIRVRDPQDHGLQPVLGMEVGEVVLDRELSDAVGGDRLRKVVLGESGLALVPVHGPAAGGEVETFDTRVDAELEQLHRVEHVGPQVEERVVVRGDRRRHR